MDKYVKKSEGGSFYIHRCESNPLTMVQYFFKKAKNICFLTGAGVSTNVGIPDFRSKEGWYSKNPSDVLSYSNLLKNPKEVYAFLYAYLKLIDVEPSITHKLIAKLEESGKNITVITQNVDMLHSKANSTDVIEFHGNFKKSNCMLCNKEYPIEKVLNKAIDTVDFKYNCDCGGVIKPNIVLFGESISELTFAEKMVAKADLVVIIGTSLSVAPFCTLPLKAPLSTPFILINNRATYLDDNNLSVVLRGDCDSIMLKLFS